MNKLFYLFAAAGAAGMMSCAHTAPADTCKAEPKACAPQYPAYYQGTLPGADVAEVSYGVVIVPFADGDTAVYAMRSEYVGAEAPNVFTEKGSVAVSKGTPADAQATVYTLTPEGASKPSYYFVATPDGLTMVNENLEAAASDLNYTLTRQM